MTAVLVTAAGIVAYYLLDLPPIGLAAPVAGVLYVAAERGRLRAAAVIAAGLLAVSVAGRLAEGDDPAYVLGRAPDITVVGEAGRRRDGARGRAHRAARRRAHGRADARARTGSPPPAASSRTRPSAASR